MEPEKQIDILLKEYDTLRAEACVRINFRFAFLGLICGTITLALAGDKDGSREWLFCLTVALSAIWFYIGQLLNRIRSGIQRVEREINTLAGARLLTWESEASSRLLGRVHNFLKAPTAPAQGGIREPIPTLPTFEKADEARTRCSEENTKPKGNH